MARARTRWHFLLMMVLLALLFADWKYSGDVNFPKRKQLAYVMESYSVFQSPGGLVVEPNDGTRLGTVTMSIVVADYGWWASVERFTLVRLDVSREDGMPATAGELASIGSRLAVMRGADDVAAVLLGKGGGTNTERLPWGYVHNVAAILLVFGVLWCAAGMVRSRFVGVRARNRERDGLCVACGYPLQASGPCPECGSERAL